MSRATDPKVVLKGTVISESAKAVRFEIYEMAEDILTTHKTEWFPFSQVSKIVKTQNKGEDTLIVSKWILSQKGLI